MKNIFSFITVFLYCLTFVSCNNITIPNDPKNEFSCDTLPSWMYSTSREYFPLREVSAISKNQDNYLFNTINGVVYYSKTRNESRLIPYRDFGLEDFHDYNLNCGILPCPYDNNKIMIIIEGTNNDRKYIQHWYLFDIETNVSKKITPFKYRLVGLNDTVNIASPISWLTTSTVGNDFIYTRSGIYHLQNDDLTNRVQDGEYIQSVSPDGKYKWHSFQKGANGVTRPTGLLLNGKQITGNDVPGTTLFRSKNIRWSSDSKYISIIAFTDRRIEPVTLTEIHIVNVEKTYNEGKIVIDKTINLRDSYCVFRSGLTAQITTNGKVLLSMSFNQKDAGILYEVDIETGKRTPIIYD